MSVRLRAPHDRHLRSVLSNPVSLYLRSFQASSPAAGGREPRREPSAPSRRKVPAFPEPCCRRRTDRRGLGANMSTVRTTTLKCSNLSFFNSSPCVGRGASVGRASRTRTTSASRGRLDSDFSARFPSP